MYNNYRPGPGMQQQQHMVLPTVAAGAEASVMIPDSYKIYTRDNVLGTAGSTGAVLDEPVSAPYISSDVVISLRRQMLEQQHHHSTELLRMQQKMSSQQKQIDALQEELKRAKLAAMMTMQTQTPVGGARDTFENEEYNQSMAKLQTATFFRHMWPSANPNMTYSSMASSSGRAGGSAKVTDWEAFKKVVIPLGLLVHLKQAFQQADHNHTGHLDVEKLGRWVQNMGMKYVSYSQLQAMIQQVDTNSNGTVEWWEFVGMQVFLNLELHEFDLKQWMLFCTQVYIPQGAGLFGHTVTQ